MKYEHDVVGTEQNVDYLILIVIPSPCHTKTHYSDFGSDLSRFLFLIRVPRRRESIFHLFCEMNGAEQLNRVLKLASYRYYFSYFLIIFGYRI